MNGESHRVYWQQWSNNNATHDVGAASVVNRSRRDLITASAAVRITPEAKAEDVTKLLRESSSVRAALSVNHESKDDGDVNSTSWLTSSSQDDSIVLVGTLYSLPPNFIRFEHEERVLRREHELHGRTGSQGQASPSSAQSIQPRDHASPSKHRQISVPSCQPVHVVRTLRPHENPNSVRKHMVERLRNLQCQADAASALSSGAGVAKAPHSCSPVLPKLQFFYLHPLIHNPTLDLDGYMTSLDDDDDDDSEAEAAHDEDEECECSVELQLFRQFPWLSPQLYSLKDTADGAGIQTSAGADDHLLTSESSRRLNYLRQHAAQSKSTCLSGYLLKRSPEDLNVWRRVHCVLTDDRLWVVSRMYEDENESRRNPSGQARYRCIRLARALLIIRSSDPSASSHMPLLTASRSDLPFCFEVVSASGVSHFFRATNPRALASWIPSLQARITQSGENCLMDYATLIMKDENLARSKRASSCGALPLWNAVERCSLDTRSETLQEELTSVGLTRAGLVGKVLRWGLEVSSFKETCKCLHSRLPAKSPIVAVNPPAHNGSNSLDGKGSSHTHASSSSDLDLAGDAAHGEPLEPSLSQMIQDSWDLARELLDGAVHLGRDIRERGANAAGTAASPSPPRSPVLHSSIETHCRHVEFILTGKFRPLSNDSEPSFVKLDPKVVDARSRDTAVNPPKKAEVGAPKHEVSPPPVDLFDELLRDLQEHAAVVCSSLPSRNSVSKNEGDEKQRP